MVLAKILLARSPILGSIQEYTFLSVSGGVEVLDLNGGNSDEQVETELASTPRDEEDVTTTSIGLPKDYRVTHDHPKDQIIGDTASGIRTRSSFNLMVNYMFMSILELKDVVSALEDSY